MKPNNLLRYKSLKNGRILFSMLREFATLNKAENGKPYINISMIFFIFYVFFILSFHTNIFLYIF